jgi:putative tributyrin esterase
VISLRTDLFSEALGMGTSAVILMPQESAGIGMEGGTASADDAAGRAGGRAGEPAGVPVLYLLHGLSDDCTIWTRRTAIERYASEKGIAIVMPEVRRSFYIDEALGDRYWTYVSEELPALLARTFRISTAREDTFVAGLSMGGYGSMKLALNHPERFAAAATFSGVMDLPELAEQGGTVEHQMARRLWDGTDPHGTGDDLMGLLGDADPTALPPLFLDCGTEDDLVDQNRRFIDLAEQRSVDLTSRLRPGVHSWEFWDRSIQDTLDWLPIRTAGDRAQG